ncbi:MAG: hypothetical protein Q7S19_03935 [bacterium]|nr:hypothetical protein [bacterium]
MDPYSIVWYLAENWPATLGAMEWFFTWWVYLLISTVGTAYVAPALAIIWAHSSKNRGFSAEALDAGFGWPLLVGKKCAIGLYDVVVGPKKNAISSNNARMLDDK